MKEHLALVTTKEGLQRLAGITLLAVFATCLMLVAETLI
jgi:hypothetical protein